MIPVGEAQQHVMSQVSVLAPVQMHVSAAQGCVLAESIVAGEDVPQFVNSAVDGYAVRAADTVGAPVTLHVVDTVAAGASSDKVVGQGEAIRIMTGAPMPAGADASVMVEDTERIDGGSSVLVQRSVDHGVAVRSAGDDITAGTVLYTAGTALRPAMAGVLASVNVRSAAFVPRARVAVLSTGDELVTDGSALRPGQIRESNKTMLLALVTEAGCEAIDFGVVVDDESALEATLRLAASECDAIVTSGGVSMGDYDVVKAVLSRIADMRWMQIAIKPAKPFAFGLLAVDDNDNDSDKHRHVPVFGLPGNPVSSLVSFELFARPALRSMMGHAQPGRPRFSAVAPDGLSRRGGDGKTHFVRVFGAWQADGHYAVRTVGGQGSHQLAASSMATALAILPDDLATGDGVLPGGSVEVLLLWVE